MQEIISKPKGRDYPSVHIGYLYLVNIWPLTFNMRSCKKTNEVRNA